MAGRLHGKISFMGLTRIRPNNCAFKDAFFGSNPLEFNSGAVKIGHGILPGAVRRNNPKLLDQVRAVRRPSTTAFAPNRLTQIGPGASSFFTPNGTMACGVIHGRMTEAEVSEFLIYFKASLRQFHTRDVCSRA